MIVQLMFIENDAGTGVMSADSNILFDVTIFSKPFLDSNGNYFYWVQYDGHDGWLFSSDISPQKSLFLIDSDAQPVAKQTVGLASAYYRYNPCNVFKRGADKWLSPSIKRYDLVSTGLQKLETKKLEEIVTIESLSSMIIPASMSYEYDGASLVEQGFLTYPEGVTITAVGSGSGIGLAAGDYGYRAIYKWRDASGALHSSAPSPVVTYTVDETEDSLTIRVPKLLITKKTGAVIALYRTDTDKNIYYLLEEVESAFSGSSYYDFSDNGSANITDDEQLYTTGGVIENIQPPVTRTSCIYQSRQFCVNEENEKTEVRYSKEFLLGEGVLHSDFLRIYVPPEGGIITALGVLDDKLIIFKESMIYATYGEGLNDLGLGRGFVRPFIVSQRRMVSVTYLAR